MDRWAYGLQSVLQEMEHRLEARMRAYEIIGFSAKIRHARENHMMHTEGLNLSYKEQLFL